MDARCGTCRYGERHAIAAHPAGATLIWCRRYPPQVVDHTDEDGVRRLMVRSPLMKSAEWCGEHQPKEV